MNEKPIKIGVVLPFSGGEEIFGNQGLQGAKMAVAEINEAGGVLGGRKFELIMEDTMTDVRTAVERTKKLIFEDKVHAILGPTSSAARDEMVPVVTEHKVPLLYGTDYEGGSCYRYLFCYSPIPDHYIKPFIPYLIENYGKSLYLLGSDYVWAISINNSIKDSVPKLGGTVAGEEYTPFPGAVKDFSPYIQNILNSKAKVVVAILLGSDGQTFLKQFREVRVKNNIKLAVMAFCESYIPGLTNEEVEGVITCVHFLSTLDRPETKNFVDRQRKMFGPDTVVSYFAESHYGLLMLYKNAIDRTQSDDNEKIIDAMGDQTLLVGHGEVTMRSSDHHMILNMIIAEVSNGILLQKEYIGPISPDDQCGGKKMG